jgi:integrase
MSKAAKAEEILGAELTGSVAASGSDIPLGSYDPNNRARRYVRCSAHPGEPYDRFASIPGAGPLRWAEVEAAGWEKPCPSCARRNKGLLRLSTHSAIDLDDRDRSGKYARATCGICGYRGDDDTPHLVALSLGENQTGFCPTCQPWAAIALTAEHLANPSLERKIIYEKIVRVRGMLEGDNGYQPDSLMPFCALVKKFAEQYPQSAPVGGPQSSETRHLLLFFEDRVIGEFTTQSGDQFADSFAKGNNRLGHRSSTSATPPLDLLKRMFGFAYREGWIIENPFSKGRRLNAPPPHYKPERIMTVSEEEGLHAACSDNFAYLLPVLIYVADVPAYLRDFLKLKWSDVDFGASTIRGHKSLVEMTARLRAVMMVLWDSSDRRLGSSIISRSVDSCNYDLEKVRKALGIDGLTWTDIRRTGALRLREARIPIDRIAERLGVAIRNLPQFLAVNSDAARQEIESLSFKKLSNGLFGELVNGDGQRNGSGNVPHREREDRDKWLFEAVDKIATRWVTERDKEKDNDKISRSRVLARVRQEDVASDIGITVAALKQRFGECGLSEMFPAESKPYVSLRTFVADQIDAGDTRQKICSDLKALKRREADRAA